MTDFFAVVAIDVADGFHAVDNSLVEDVFADIAFAIDDLVIVRNARNWRSHDQTLFCSGKGVNSSVTGGLESWLREQIGKIRTESSNTSELQITTQERQLNNPEEPKNQNSNVGAWIGIGSGIGVALGAAMDNVGLGIALGVAIGAAIGSGIDASQSSKPNRD